MPKVGSSMELTSSAPNFKRDQFASLAEMKSCTICDEGHVSFCTATGKRYQFKSANQVDQTLGKWRLTDIGDSVDYTETEWNTMTAQEQASVKANNALVYITED